MSSYRPNSGRESSGDQYRSLPAYGSNHRGSHHDSRRSQADIDRRSPPPPRRYTPPHDAYRSRRGPGDDSDSRGPVREWDLRRDRDRARDYERDRDTEYNGRSPSPARGRRGQYRDWDREDHHRAYGYDSRSRSRSPSRDRRRTPSPYYGGPPSRDVIMEGLPPDMESDDDHSLLGSWLRRRAGRLVVRSRAQISEELHQGYHIKGLQDVRVIKDRATGASRQFGFLHFDSVDAAGVFLDENYPSIYLYGSGSSKRSGSVRDQATKVRVSFCREKDDRERSGRLEDEWSCQVCSFPNYARRTECRRCQSQRLEIPPDGDTNTYHYTNTGDSDVSPDGATSQFLLFRGLEATVTAQLLAKGAAKLYKSRAGSPPAPAATVPKKPAAKVSSTTAEANLGAREGSIRRVLLVKDRRTDESWRYGFVEFATVEDSQAALAKFNSLEKFTISSKPVLLSFVHTGVFVPVFDYAPGLEKFTFSPLNNPSMRLAYWDEEGYVSELMLASEEISSTSQSKDRSTAAGRPQAASVADIEGIKPVKEGEGKSKKRKIEAATTTSNKKTVPAHLNFWRNRHAELHGIQPEDPDQASSGSTTQVKDSSHAATGPDDGPPAQSFADPNRKCCLLCARQFKSDAEVNKHERLSQLHRDNLKNEEARAKAFARLAKAGIDVTDTPAYRDRAKERRATYNQPRRPAAEPSASRAPAPAAAEAPAEEAPVQSKGAALLGKMGWTAGEGLGAEGTGITAPVATDMYVQGVGLGAQGGKVGDAVEEAERNTTSRYGEFLERTKDKAKERFQQLG